MPRVKSFAQKEADRALKARIASLPKDVQTAVLAMEPEARQDYLNSLDKAADMEAKGETWTPHGGYSSAQSRARSKYKADVDPAAPYGRTKSGEPKAKPGRRPAANAGARTAEQMERSLEHPELVEQWNQKAEAVISEADEDNEDFGSAYARHLEQYGGSTSSTIEPTNRLTDDQKHAEAEAELRAALERQGIPEALVGPVAAVRLVPQGDPDDLANYRVDRIECELRMIDTGKAYRLEVRYPPSEVWEAIADTYEPSGSAQTMARMQIRPIDWDAFGKAISALPKPHPHVAARFDNRPRDARGPDNERERDLLNSNIREQMVTQRRSNALHRQEPTAGRDYNWLTN